MKFGSRQVIVALAAITAAALVAAGCGESSKNDSGGGKLAKTQTLVMNFGDQPTTLDPALAADLYSTNAINQMFVGLTRLVGEKNELQYHGAKEAPEISDDGKTVTYTIRDMKWSNGDPLTAQDYRYGMLRSLDPKTAARFASYMFDIVGAAEYNEGKGSAEDVGIEAVDDTTLEFTLVRPVPWFDQLLSLTVFYAMPQTAIEKYGDKWTAPANIVVNGPFEMTENKPKQQIVLVKNRDYYNADEVKLERAVLKQISNQKSAYTQFKGKKIDLALPSYAYDNADIDKVKLTPEFRSLPVMSTSYVYINTKVKAKKLDNPLVRQAIALALDRKSIVENITKRGDVPLSTVIPTNLAGYDTIKEGAQETMSSDGSPNIDKAKDLLAEAGWKDGTELNYYFAGESSTDKDSAILAQADLAKVGIKLKLVDKGTFDSLYAEGIATPPLNDDVDLVSIGWIADYDDAQDFYNIYTCDNIAAGLNTSQYCNKEFDAALDEARDILDTDARHLEYKKIEAMLTGPEGAFPSVPLYQQADAFLVHAWVKGFDYSPQGMWNLDTVKLLER